MRERHACVCALNGEKEAFVLRRGISIIDFLGTKGLLLLILSAERGFLLANFQRQLSEKERESLV